MLELTLPRLSRAARDWFIGSPLERSADPYVQCLLERGYAVATIRSYLMSVAHLAHWLDVHRYGLGDLNETLLDRFVRRHLPRCRCADRLPHVPYCVRPALLHLLRLLRAEEQIAPGKSDDPPTIVVELREFDRYLMDVRGLAQTTRYSRMIRVRAFLLDLFGDRRIQLETLHRSDIVGFMARYTANWKPQSKQCMVSSLQSYFRFKAISGVATTTLSAALPTIAHWKLATLRKGLSATELSRLLGAFDRTCATGRRDYAITRCFADLGLRTAEIARLQLDDVDWQEGTLRIRGKGRRVDLLPLPPVTGRAIVAYLRAGRPRSDEDALFLRHTPPVGRPATRCIVRNAVRFAAARCGLERVGGPHILRHTVATRLVQGGATLKQIADVLRHRCLDTTSIYAKVNMPRPVAHGDALAREALMNARSTMRSKVEAYLAERRQAGFELKIDGEQLARFARFTDSSGYRGALTIAVASRWALASKHGRRLTAARRIEVLRGFARYCQSFESGTEIPPLRLFGPGHRRLTPHIFTDAEIHSLLQAASSLIPVGGLRAATCATVFGLIAATGLRISEAAGLGRSDVDLCQGCLQIREGKFHKSRWVPLHPSAVQALRRYARQRDRDPLTGVSDAFFVFDYGRAASVRSLHHAFKVLRRELRWRARGGHRYPRIHDLRHTFISKRLERWYQDGTDIERNILALSTYVGHAHVTDTYWYVTATPKLMAIAANRLAPLYTGGVS